MKDEDYAFETQRQKRLDEASPEVEALLKFRATLEKYSRHPELTYRYGFLCNALSNTILSREEYDFIKELINRALDGHSILTLNVTFSPNYLHDVDMFAAINHAYRLGVVDQWITNYRRLSDARG